MNLTTLDKLNFKWETMGSVSPHDLVDARKRLHHAVQLIAAAGKLLIPERPDDSHTSLHWNKVQQAFEGETIGQLPSLIVGLSPANLTLYVREDSKENKATYALKGKTLDSALSWLKSKIGSNGFEVSNMTLQMHYEIPSHAVGVGQAFRVDNPDHFKEIGRYFANANNILQAIKLIIPETGEVRCWPHHFDIATLIKLDKDKSTGEKQSIGIGLSPGDDEYEEPYFYISPWPYPDIQKIKLPDLLSGKWHTEDWVGARLLASDFSSDREQTETVLNFFIGGISACAEILNHRL
jgi:hypothetical protein